MLKVYRFSLLPYCPLKKSSADTGTPADCAADVAGDCADVLLAALVVWMLDGGVGMVMLHMPKSMKSAKRATIPVIHFPLPDFCFGAFVYVIF